MRLSRRTLLYSAAATAGAGFGLRAQPLPRPLLGATKSGLVTGKRKPLRRDEIAGFLSKEQLRWHHESHYGDALKGFNKLDADPTGNHRSRIAKANSVVLHELYFDGMTAEANDPGSATEAALAQRFGSVDLWTADFHAAAKSCRGWAVLGYHPINGKLYNMTSDSHDDGPSWFGVPLVVVDMYEHAYYLDYQNKKVAYAEKFTDKVDWTEVERRLRACQR
ncbi:MAG: hypothetical protein CMJ85_05480 [Planctomycetes bacterium]|jgi:Fe-Mn family superoxide dismutase|nr:hypothetical protein [Planctomycetota bacterium]MDP6424053.1 Fe-Mn family superoxide dismutase [Planctomycetota bacterium]